jgi:hypothetical protein
MMKDDLFEDYVHEIGFLIKEMALEAKADRESAKGTPSEAYATGYLTGFYAVVTTMLQLADGFQIPAEKLTWEGLDPDKDLL